MRPERSLPMRPRSKPALGEPDSRPGVHDAPLAIREARRLPRPFLPHERAPNFAPHAPSDPAAHDRKRDQNIQTQAKAGRGSLQAPLTGSVHRHSKASGVRAPLPRTRQPESSPFADDRDPDGRRPESRSKPSHPKRASRFERLPHPPPRRRAKYVRARRPRPSCWPLQRGDDARWPSIHRRRRVDARGFASLDPEPQRPRRSACFARRASPSRAAPECARCARWCP